MCFVVVFFCDSFMNLCGTSLPKIDGWKITLPLNWSPFRGYIQFQGAAVVVTSNSASSEISMLDEFSSKSVMFCLSCLFCFVLFCFVLFCLFVCLFLLFVCSCGCSFSRISINSDGRISFVLVIKLVITWHCVFKVPWKFGGRHPGRLTWNIIMEVWKIMFLSKWVICRFHGNLMLIFQGVWKEKSLLQVLILQSNVLEICYLQTHVSTKRDGCWTWGEVDSSRFPNENPSCFWIFVCVKPLPVVFF